MVICILVTARMRRNQMHCFSYHGCKVFFNNECVISIVNIKIDNNFELIK